MQVLRGYLKAKCFTLLFVVDGVCACGTEVSTHVEGGHLFKNGALAKLSVARWAPPWFLPPLFILLLLLFFPLEEALFISEARINIGSIRQPQYVSLLCGSLILTIRPPADNSRMEPYPSVRVRHE